MKFSLIGIVMILTVIGLASQFTKAGTEVIFSSASGSTAARDDFDKLLVEAWKLYQERKYDEAVKVCEKLIVLRPDDNRGYAITGVVYLEVVDLLSVVVQERKDGF